MTGEGVKIRNGGEAGGISHYGETASGAAYLIISIYLL